MIVASGVFASGTSNFHLLLFAAIVGVISPSGSETGPFKTIEETVLANLTPPNHRPEVYAIHWILGSIGASIGSFLAGLIVDYLTLTKNYQKIHAYKFAFGVLVFTSFLKFISLLFVSRKVEPDYIPPYKQVTYDSTNNEIADESQNSIQTNTSNASSERRPLIRIESTIEHTTMTGLSPTTQRTLFKLLVPFMIDSFGWGFMTNAWVVYYFAQRYKVSAIALGILFGIAGLAMSVSALPSAWFAKKFGPIKSSILTQIPCGLFFISIPILGKNFPIAATLFMLNQLTVAFDVVPRQIILTSLIEPVELAKVMGTVNIGKQIARSISPFTTGFFAEAGLLWVCFILSGGFLILANIILAVDFNDLDGKVKQLEEVNHDIA